MDEIAIPAHVAFSELSCNLGNQAFGCLVRAALWRATHGWQTKSGDVEYFIPRSVAHTIGPVEVWDRIVECEVCIEHSVDNEVLGYVLCIDWPVVTFNEQQCDYKFHFPAEVSRKAASGDAYGGSEEKES